MKFLTFLSVLLVVVHAALTTTTPARNCILHADGVESCTQAPDMLPATDRQSAPCAKMDMKCWCMKAKDYTNDVRRRHGQRKMLKVGPMRQLDNAVQYAGVLGNKGFLEHQNLGDATKKVGCGRFIGGENIAYNYNSGDVAKACVDQWEGSSGHLENILRDHFEEVVIGFHFESDGRVYCVQTFATKGSFGTAGSPSDARCQPVSRASGPKPTKPVTTRPAPRTRRKPKMNMKMKNEGNRSCRCIELGRRCWWSLRRLSGNRCKARVAGNRQPMMCKRKCCSYCKHYPNTPPCRSGSVKSICRHL